MRKRRSVFFVCFILCITFLLSSLIFSVFYMSGVDLRPIGHNYGSSPSSGWSIGIMDGDKVGVSKEEIKKNLEILNNI